MMRIASLAILLAVSSTYAAAEPSNSQLSIERAYAAAHTAMIQCRQDGYRVSAAVVDSAGLVKALLRDDGAGPHTLDSSRRKAYTAASLRESTAKLAALVAKHPELQALGHMNESILLLGGGLPIQRGATVVGGIGVGGAPGAELDEACARAGLNAIDDEL